MKTCVKCGEEKAIEDYNFKIKAKGIRQNKCRSCHRAYTAAHYNANKQYYIDKAKEYDKSIRCRLSDLKSEQGCKVCGESEPVCLDFHHLNDKLGNIGTDGITQSKAWLETELKKCIVLCSNCHRKLHAGLIQIQ